MSFSKDKQIQDNDYKINMTHEISFEEESLHYYCTLCVMKNIKQITCLSILMMVQ